MVLSILNNSFFNPYYRPDVALKKELTCMSWGLHEVTNLAEQTKDIHDPFVRTGAKVGAWMLDFFTSFAKNALALIYNNAIAKPVNMWIRSSNKQAQQNHLLARRSWTPTSYKPFFVIPALASLALLGCLYPNQFAEKIVKITNGVGTYWEKLAKSAIGAPIITKIHSAWIFVAEKFPGWIPDCVKQRFASPKAEGLNDPAVVAELKKMGVQLNKLTAAVYNTCAPANATAPTSAATAKQR